mgnify:CR=1 FL=1
MVSKASISESATGCTDYSSGLSLNRRALQGWLKRKNMRMVRLAKLLKIPPRELRWKLYKRKKFSRKEITALIYVMGARQAIRVLWFPTIEEKRRIREKMEGRNMSSKFNPDIPCARELPGERKSRRIEQEFCDTYDPWEESEAMEDMMLYSDELPSRRMFRRRGNG